MIDLSIVAYIDDRIIYSQTKPKHERLGKDVPIHLNKWDVVVSIDTCKSHQSEITFLGYMISDTGISMAQDNDQIVLE
jgi:hypothetical protein